MRDIAIYGLGELLVLFDAIMNELVDNDKVSESQLRGTMVTLCRDERNQLMCSFAIPRN